MTKVPSLNYDQVLRALRRAGWVVVRQRGSHIRLQKHTPDETLKLILPAHRPIKRSTLGACRRNDPTSISTGSKHIGEAEIFEPEPNARSRFRSHAVETHYSDTLLAHILKQARLSVEEFNELL